ncbi:hypothetical protein FORC88_1866 [Salmonella enterica subsp. enterica serovar Typhimurium]|nr:hypothetical protein FORC88_1866 [Salmonella enterica subsp. enterica serovar Typhimurium]
MLFLLLFNKTIIISFFVLMIPSVITLLSYLAIDGVIYI